MSLTCHSHAICMSSVFTMYSHVIRMPLVCHSYVSVCHPYVSHMYSYLCIRMSLVCHSYVFACHPYVTRMYSYVIRIRISLVCSFTMNQHYCKCQFYCNLTDCYNLTELYNVLLCFDIIFHDNFCLNLT